MSEAFAAAAELERLADLEFPANFDFSKYAPKDPLRANPTALLVKKLSSGPETLYASQRCAALIEHAMFTLFAAGPSGPNGYKPRMTLLLQSLTSVPTLIPRLLADSQQKDRLKPSQFVTIPSKMLLSPELAAKTAERRQFLIDVSLWIFFFFFFFFFNCFYNWNLITWAFHRSSCFLLRAAWCPQLHLCATQMLSFAKNVEAPSAMLFSCKRAVLMSP
jgi:hypothetical protein